ncbi:MAG TPA: hypothetical protein VF201_07535 [Nitrolancea sp.]
MQALISSEQSNFQPSPAHRLLIDRFWDDVAPFNNYSPEAARALLGREAHVPASIDDALNDPFLAVRAALAERAAGRTITRSV